jgi:hypothetical protein
VVAAQILAAGQHIGFTAVGNTEQVGLVPQPIGIVDPFLRGYVAKGERFWMFLYPQTITSLRHDWTHPAFERTDGNAEAWLRGYADRAGVSYAVLLEAIENKIAGGDGVRLPSDIPNGLWDNLDVMYRQYEIVSGRKVPSEVSDSAPFWCSC